MLNKKIKPFLFFFIILLWGSVSAQKTETMYLSGKGSDNTVDWEFFVTDGRNSGEWTTIPVPSNWEQFGFGTYNYGHAKDSARGKEEGLYRYNFKAPQDWKKKEVRIVFEGSMTDTEVKINGELAGPVHQGSFYRFSYDISKLLNYGESNLLEVKVAKHSSNESVNKAERYSDFWIFGGIFRPVYLEAKPKQNIRRVAIDAKADGKFVAHVFTSNGKRTDELRAQVYTLDGKAVGQPFSSKDFKDEKYDISTEIENIKSWNPEDPNLYKVTFSLYSKGEVVHEFTQRFGFRTIEVRPREGIYVNGVKIKFKGVNRHTFTPEYGRASSKALSIRDVKEMKNMNMNAVRSSHYPPDTHFLDVCDSLGLFVIDELTGWHDAYDTEVGSKLVKEMVTRDVNHPSVIIWSNGNEGGHNPELDSLYTKYDIQNRLIIHPWEEYNGTATQHYRCYDYGVGTYLHGHKIVFPTEFLHGMYDGGLGAGLYDYWEQMWETPISAGGFLWVFADEGIARTDKDGEIDTYGSKAPDGIMGPYHEREGSYYAIKEIWSPVQLRPREITQYFDGKLEVENRYFYTNLKECSFSWKLAAFPIPGEDTETRQKERKINSPDIDPGHWGEIKLNLPDDWSSYDVLYISAKDKYGRELYTWSYPVSLPEDLANEIMKKAVVKSGVSYEENGSDLIIKAGEVTFTLGKNDGQLIKVENKKGVIPFNSGPALSAGIVVFDSINTKMDGDTLLVICSFNEKESRMKEFTWSFYPSGLAGLNIIYQPEEYDVPFDLMGVDFTYPEDLVEGVKWLGKGPYRVWKNRQQGVELGLYQKDYNSTITGVSPLVYPEFKGYHADLYWAEIQSKEQSFVVATSTRDVFLRLYTPAQPEEVFERVTPAFPGGDISFMQAIPPIGTKSNDPWNMGPSGRKNMFFDYGPYDDWRKRSKILDLYFDFRAKE